ncbi:MAG: hypothetical protein M3295_06580 [Chloroflexota bacterium]|nr:hypothetical protein [Chloroflexota bacterium]
MKILVISMVLMIAIVVTGCTGSQPASSVAPQSASASASVSPSASASTTSIATPAATIEVASLSGRILFTRVGGRFGDETVYTGNADGSEERQITEFGATCCPRWSPDGAYVLYGAMTDDRITTALVNPDGTPARIIPLPAGDLNLGCAQAWSIATDRLGCEGWVEGDPEHTGIYTIRAADGGDVQQVTESVGGNDRPFDFSPDGSQIFFFRESDQALYVANVDGTDLQRVTPEDVRVEAIDVGTSGGRLSRDGQLIVFADEAGVMWTIRPDGSDLTELYRDPQGRLVVTPTWSPDGSYVMFGLDPAGSNGNLDDPQLNALYVANADGSDPTPVIDTDDWKLKPDWAE